MERPEAQDALEPSSVSAAEIQRRLDEVRERIAAAAARAGRDPDEIQLVAVSKTQPAEVVRAGYRAGLRMFGENRVEEALPKQAQLADLGDIEWHMVGHIQSRKAKPAATAFQFVHSVDRLKVARRLNLAAVERLSVTLECNVSGEQTKFGWRLEAPDRWPQVLAEFSELQALPKLRVVGLMTMAPVVAESEQARPAFRRLRELRDYLRASLPGEWEALSMGMTDDFEVAVEEGATLLRIGRAIFGPQQVG